MKKPRVKNGNDHPLIDTIQPDPLTPTLNERQDRELTNLSRWAGATTFYLLAMLIASLWASVLQVFSLSQTAAIDAGAAPGTIMLCIATGALGSSMMALRSIIERIANGWELSDSTKLPLQEPKDKFVAKMVPGFLARPFLGASVGFLVYLAVVGGFWIVISPNSNLEFRPFGLAFLALLGGLFAKTFLKQLKGVFDTIFGSQKSTG